MPINAFPDTVPVSKLIWQFPPLDLVNRELMQRFGKKAIIVCLGKEINRRKPYGFQGSSTPFSDEIRPALERFDFMLKRHLLVSN